MKEAPLPPKGEDAKHGIPDTPIAVFLTDHGVKTSNLLNSSAKRSAVEAADDADREEFRREVLASDRDPSTILRIAQRIAPSERQASTGRFSNLNRGRQPTPRGNYPRGGPPAEKREAWGTYIGRAIDKAEGDFLRRHGATEEEIAEFRRERR
jgi:hypothetical protein